MLGHDKGLHTMKTGIFDMPHRQTSGTITDQADLDRRHLQMQTVLEDLSEKLRCTILKCPPLSLLSFLWGRAVEDEFTHEHGVKGEISDLAADIGIALEYVHAVLSSHAESENQGDESDALSQEVLTLAGELRKLSQNYCAVAARRYSGNLFGNHTRTLSYHAMSSWVSVRGYRYQYVESEFFEFVLAPHEDALKRAYGIGAAAIAKGLQAAVDAPLAIAQTAEDHVLARLANSEARNLIKTSGLPRELLADLAYVRGSETDFFSPGALRGTPLRTMPGKVKPLVAIDDGYYACDPYFIRDSTYRTIQRALRERLPGYTVDWKEKQTELTENAFQQIFRQQLQGAEMFRSVYYYDQSEKKWYENDALILLDDVMLLIEVKAGVMAMDSPESHFDRYARKVTELVVKAYNQCARFLRYAASQQEVALHYLIDGAYHEVRRLRLADYRHILPIGLTVEAFTPISSYCKELDEIQPILGKYPFISMSIDDLFVLSHFLPSCGELLHYLDVRQKMAGIKEAFLYDEVDHLGMYIDKNRFDVFAASCVEEGCELLVFYKSSNIINRYFANADWRNTIPPRQVYPDTVARLLASIDKTRGPRFLRADSLIRNMGNQRRENLAAAITELLPGITPDGTRHIRFLSAPPILVCLQRPEHVDFVGNNPAEAEVVALAAGATTCELLLVHVGEDGEFAGAWAGSVAAPAETDRRYSLRMSRAKRLHQLAKDHIRATERDRVRHSDTK